VTIIEANARQIETVVLAQGSHPDKDAMCVMEAVAYVAGEDWSDHPQCAAPVIGSSRLST